MLGEWPLHLTTTGRLNAGVQVAGNTLTGLVGIPDRGLVLSAGGSLAYAVMPRVSLPGELTGYQGRARSAADRELRAQGALTYALDRTRALAVSVQRGWFASPPWTLQVGVTLDWSPPRHGPPPG